MQVLGVAVQLENVCLGFQFGESKLLARLKVLGRFPHRDIHARVGGASQRDVPFSVGGDRLAIRPCVPVAWPEFTIDYRFGASLYSIRVLNSGTPDDAPRQISLDGTDLPDEWIPLVDDGGLEPLDLRLERRRARSVQRS